MEKIKPKEVQESPGEGKLTSHVLFILLIPRNWITSVINIMPRPTPIIFKSNSVHLERASSATLARKSEYASICLLMGNIVLQLSFLSNNKFLIVCDQLSSA